MNAPLASALDTLGTPTLLVWGDYLLDRYTWGDAQQVSPEAPVLVLRADHNEGLPGGAGSVCRMLRGLGAEVKAAGLIGDDPAGQQLRVALDDCGVDHHALLPLPGGGTTIKHRFIGRAAHRHPHQILRVDEEHELAIDPKLEAALLAMAMAALDGCDAVLISDYAKGACTSRAVQGLIEAARQRSLPVLVDPAHHADYARYHGATLVTPNRVEAERATGLKITSPPDAIELGRRLCHDHALQAAVVTLDRDGMALVLADGEGDLFGTEVRQVYDITGAGDMVLAMLGMAIAAGLSWASAVRLANAAAGLKVEKFGAAQITRGELRARLLRDSSSAGKRRSLDEMVGLAQSYRRQGRRVVFTNGCFDLLHVGHVKYLEEAAALGDVLVVAINSDRSVRALKGGERPVIREADRAALLAALACVDHVLVFDAATPLELLSAIQPDVLVKGGTYSVDEVVGRELVESYGGQVRLTSRIEGVSTTQILDSLRGHRQGVADWEKAIR